MADACRLADVLLHNLWRWVSSQQAAMYSQSLHLAVAALQRKMLAQLVAELTRLGATVIAANASSLILGTGKPDTPSAVGQAPTELQPAVKRWHYMALMDHPGQHCSTDACSGMQVRRLPAGCAEAQGAVQLAAFHTADVLACASAA